MSLSLMTFIFIMSSRWFYYSPISCCSDCWFWRWLIFAFDFQLLILNLILIINIVVFIVRYLSRCFFRFNRSQSISISPIYLAVCLVSWWCNCEILHISFRLQLPSIFSFDKRKHLVLLLITSNILDVGLCRRLVLIASELFNRVCRHYWLIFFLNFSW